MLPASKPSTPSNHSSSMRASTGCSPIQSPDASVLLIIQRQPFTSLYRSTRVRIALPLLLVESKGVDPFSPFPSNCPLMHTCCSLWRMDNWIPPTPEAYHSAPRAIRTASIVTNRPDPGSPAEAGLCLGLLLARAPPSNTCCPTLLQTGSSSRLPLDTCTSHKSTLGSHCGLR